MLIVVGICQPLWYAFSSVLKPDFNKLKLDFNKDSFIPTALTYLAALIYTLLILGGWVRNMGAGLACPDWPLCFGQLLPHFNIRIFAEFFHRLIAGLVSLLFLFLVIKITLNRSWRALLGRLNILALMLLASQVVLGGLTVLQLLKSEIVTLHLATGTLFFCVVSLMALRARRFGRPPIMYTIAKDKKRKIPTDLWRWGVASVATVYLQIVLGGVVSSHYAGLACPDFPTCLGQWFPGLEGTVGIQIIHRIGAFVSLIVVGTFVFKMMRGKPLPDQLTKLPRLVAGALILQIGLGIGNVLARLPVWMSVSHLAIAELLFALVLISTYEIRHFQLHQSD